ncbi:MAG: hypothetical protein IKU30_01090 [Clostridia bacterium]|nr:hypothetical protein [Clostridia bacterium]
MKTEILIVISTFIVGIIMWWAFEFIQKTRIEMGEIDEDGNEIFPPKDFVCCADCKKLQYKVENNEIVCFCEENKRKMKGFEEVKNCYCMEGENREDNK